MATSHTNPAYIRQEQIADTNWRRLAREQPFLYDMATKFNTSSCTYLYNQPCGLWNEECHHGCGYIHLLSSSSSTKKKCCAIGALSSVSDIGHGFMLSLSIAKWRNLLDSQLLVYDGDKQAPPDLLNLLPKETDLDPDTLLMRHELIVAFLCRIANASNIQPNMFP